MRRGFRRVRGGRVLLHLDETELAVLASLVTDLVELVAPPEPDQDADPLAVLVGIDDVAEVPEDPAVARLLPDAYRDDPAAAADFRRFTERSLREGKVERAAVVLDGLAAADEAGEDVVTVDREGAQAWLGVLNDLRLVLAARLDITDDERDELRHLPDDDPRAVPMTIYDWLTWLQDSLLRTLGAPDPPRDAG